ESQVCGAMPMPAMTRCRDDIASPVAEELSAGQPSAAMAVGAGGGQDGGGFLAAAASRRAAMPSAGRGWRAAASGGAYAGMASPGPRSQVQAERERGIGREHPGGADAVLESGAQPPRHHVVIDRVGERRD